MSPENRPPLQQINLFNPELLPKPVIFPAWQVVTVIAVGIVMLFGSGFAMKNRASHLEQSNQQRTDQIKQLAQQQSELENQLARRKPDAALVETVERLAEKQKNQQHTLDLLLKTAHDPKTGFAETLRALARQRLEGLWLTDITLQAEQRMFEGSLIQPELLPRWLEGLAGESSFANTSYQVMEIDPPAAGRSVPAASEGEATAAAATPTAVPPVASGPYHFRLATKGVTGTDKGRQP